MLARQRAINLEYEQAGGPRRHFEYDWRAAAACNPNYGRFVRAEIERLGEDHLAVQTQYFLHTINGAGLFFNPLQRQLLQGSHQWECEPDHQGGHCYVAGLDIAGEERADPANPERINLKRDSTLLTIGRVYYNDLQLPCIEVVHHVQWIGKTYPEQYAALLALCEHWDLRRLVVDNTGQGAGLASLLLEKLGEERVEFCTFTRPTKSRLGYQLLALVNSCRLKLYSRSDAPRPLYSECWQQINQARYSLPGQEIINFFVDPQQGHDDFLISLALIAQALNGLLHPPVAQIVHPTWHTHVWGHLPDWRG